MRIGIVLPEAPQYSETFFNYKIKGLQESGIEVIVFSNRKEMKKYSYEVRSAHPVFNKKPLKQLFFFSFVLAFSFISNYSNSMKLYNLERENSKSFSESLKSVYINAHILSAKLEWLHFGFATMSMKKENVAKAIGAKMSVSLRGYDINIYPLKNRDCYKDLWKNVDKVHTISEYLHRKGLNLGLSAKVPFEKITPAIDVDVFRMKEDLGIIKSPIKILTVGRLNWIKDYETAISAMKILKQRGLEFIYNIIGTGPELERLTFAVYQSDLMDRVFFLGRKDHNEVNLLMNESDMYLQTSMQEGFCGSVLEAQAKGLLCVVTDADGLKENVVDGVTGWITQRRKPIDIANKIIEVISYPVEKRREIALTALNRVQTEFNIADQKKKFVNFFAS